MYQRVLELGYIRLNDKYLELGRGFVHAVVDGREPGHPHQLQEIHPLLTMLLYEVTLTTSRYDNSKFNDQHQYYLHIFCLI